MDAMNRFGVTPGTASASEFHDQHRRRRLSIGQPESTTTRPTPTLGAESRSPETAIPLQALKPNSRICETYFGRWGQGCGVGSAQDAAGPGAVTFTENKGRPHSC